MSPTDPLLSVTELRTYFDTPDGELRAVDGVGFDVKAGETVCLVGESGAGKTVTCESVTDILPSSARIEGGSITFDGTEITRLSEPALRDLRGNRIAHVFQHPQEALDPVYTVGDQLIEAIAYHRDLEPAAARARAIDLLDRTGIPNAAARIDDYPHEFSGGMRQRIVIAAALANDPDLLIADEPTAAIDVTFQAQILELLADLQADREMAILFVTHDLSVVAEIADRVVVMYAGKVMERGGVFEIFEEPGHPYTQALLRCRPTADGELIPIGGTIPDPTAFPGGCRFHPRCPHAVAACSEGGQPELNRVSDTQAVSCVYYRPGYDESVVQGAADTGGEHASGTGGDRESVSGGGRGNDG